MTKQYKVALIIDNEPIYTPYVINKLFNELNNNLEICCIIFTEGNYRNIDNSNDIQERINLYGRFNNFILNILYTYKDNEILKNDTLNYYKILKNRNIPYKITNNINTDEIIQFIKTNNTDIIFSLTHHILKKEILNTPNYICINRHTGKLPEYAGLQPILYTMLDQKDNNDIYITLTYHTMVERLDAGVILAEKTYKINRNTTLYGAYGIQYHDVIMLFNESVENYFNNNIKIQDIEKRKYYSFPSKNKCIEFRKNFRICTFKEIFSNLGLQ